MTAIEKAKELFDNFYWELENDYKAKQCVLIAVDEILKTFPNINGIAVYKDHVVDIEYWQQVKEEIENL